MKAIVAMDSFKGSCTAEAAGAAVCHGLARAGIEAVNLPVADGGEGTVAAVIAGGRGKWVPVSATGPMGSAVSAGYGVLSDGVCAMEMSAASGLLLVPDGEKNPLVATTYGTGELIKAALDAGHRLMMIGLGGSATNDGGAGMAQALGAKLLDGDGREIARGGAALNGLERIDISGIDQRIRDCEITCMVDVNNPLCGPRGASAIFGPQKGATPEMVELLDGALANYARVIERDMGIAVRDVPGAGAAGGLGAGMLAFLGAKFRPGIEAVLDIVGFDGALSGADFVITGEGRMDGQTMGGKVPVGVARRAKAHGGLPVFALVGGLGDGFEAVYGEGIDGALSVASGPMTLAEACRDVERLIADAAEAVGRMAVALRR